MPPKQTNKFYLITHEFHPKHGGIATFSEEIARAAVTLGYDAEVWAQQSPLEKEKNWPFKLRRMPIAGTLSMICRAGAALEMFGRRRDLRDAIVYLPEPGPQLALTMLRLFTRLLPRQLILTFHGSEILRYQQNPLHRVLMRNLINSATRVTTLTRYTRKLLCKYFPEAAGKTILTPGGIRSDLLINGAAAADNATTPPMPSATMPQAADGKRVVLTVGRIHPRKGHMHTLRALQSLPTAFRANTEYWIAGKPTGSDYEKNLRAAATKDPALTVRFLGELSARKLSAAYARADVFAMTSVNYRDSIEGFGLVYLEASAHGLPIVAHDVGGVSEAVLDGVTGLLIKPASDDKNADEQNASLTAAFEKLLADAALRKRLGEAGRKHAHSHNWLDSAKKLFALDEPTLNSV